MTCAYCDHFQSALFKAQWFTCGHVIAFSPNKLIKKNDDDGGGGDGDIITFSPQDLAGRPGPVWDHVIVCDKVGFS